MHNLLVRIHFIVVMIRWTGFALWEFEFPFPGNLTSTFQNNRRRPTSWRRTGARRATKVFIKSFYTSQFPHKSVNLSFIIKNKSTDLCGN